MRGGVSMHDLLHIYSNDDIEMMLAIINENIEITQKSHMPLL